MAGVKLKNVTKRFEGGVVAVNNFNIDIGDREFLVLVGPSGCGKTTTLRMIAGLEEITEGEIFIGDKLVNDVQPKDRDIAMVFQNYALYPHMSVYDNMAFGLKLRKTPRNEIKKRVEEASKILEIEHLLDRKPKALSGGQKQRVALGRAIVRYPKVFLMDEPLSNLDAKLRAQMRIEITKIHQRLKTTFIYVTHDQTEALTMGTRIVVMKDGFIQQIDAPQVLYENPCNVFVAEFIGSPKMNMIEAKLVKNEDDSLHLVFEENDLKVPDKRAKKLANSSYINKVVKLGIRPENLHNEEEIIAQMPDSVVEAQADVVEMLGSEILVYASVGEDLDLTARVNPRFRVKPNDVMKFAFDLNKAHLFDKETENIIEW